MNNNGDFNVAGFVAIVGGVFFVGGLLLGNHFDESGYNYNPILALLGMGMFGLGIFILISAVVVLLITRK